MDQHDDNLKAYLMHEHGMTASVPQLVTDQMDAVAAAYADLILPTINRVAFQWRALDGRKPMHSREALNRHHLAKFVQWWCLDRPANFSDMIPELTAADLKRHLAGEATYGIHSSWTGGSLWVRFDGDEHNGETDARAMLEHLKACLGGRMYICRSSRGWSGYVRLQIPTFLHESGDIRPLVKLWEMNHVRKMLADSVPHLMREHGFKAPLEIFGSFLELERPEDENGVPTGPPTVIGDLKDKVRLPYCTSVDEVHELVAAVLPINPRALCGPIAELLTEAAPARSRFEAAKADRESRELAQTEKTKILSMTDEQLDLILGKEDLDLNNADQRTRIIKGARKHKRHEAFSSIIENSHDVLINTNRCLCHAAHSLGIKLESDLYAREHEVIELALQRYIENGFGDTNNDHKRLSRFRSSFKGMAKKWKEVLAGGGSSGIWIDLDSRFTEIRMRSMISQAELDLSNEDLKKAGQLDYEKLALIGSIIAKDSELRNEQVSTNGIRGLMAYWGNELGRRGFKLSGAVIGKAVELLTLHKIIDCTRAAARGVCRCYRVLKRHLFNFLPAVAPASAPEVKPAAAGEVPVSQGDVSTGGGQVAPRGLFLSEWDRVAGLDDEDAVSSWTTADGIEFDENGEILAENGELQFV